MSFEFYKLPYSGIQIRVPYTSPPAPPWVSGLALTTPRAPGSVFSSRFQLFKMPYTGRAVRIPYISPPAPRTGIFYNTAQTYTAYCDVGDGSSSSTVPAGSVVSYFSQQDADNVAYSQAQIQAIAGLVCCYSEDPQPDTPDFNALFDSIPYVGADQYGLEGNEEIRRDLPGGISQLYNWTICPECDFCDGPEIEGITQAERYATRWEIRANPGAGTIEYGLNGSVLTPMPADLLVGLTLTDVNTVSISFDGNARVCLAVQDTPGMIDIRRYVAGTPTTHTFAGDWPRLLYNGILQRDSASIDLVCFYVQSGDIKMRFQRDNFGIEYDFVDILPAPVRVTKVDRSTYYQYTYYLDADGQFKLARSGVYPPFPIIVVEQAVNTASPAGGEYSPVVIDGGTYSEAATNSAAPSGGEYVSNTIETGPYTDNATNAAIPSGGEYTAVVIDGGSYSEAATNASQPSGGDYVLSSIDGGTYSDNATNSAAPAGGEYA